MGSDFSTLNKTKTSSLLRQSQSRINIHRSKKLNSIAKKKDDICKHLEAANETNAKIWCETLINEESLIPCYDIISIMCDQVNGRLTNIVKFGPPKDMDITFHTLIHAAPKVEVDELSEVRKQLGGLLGKEFVKKSDSDYSCINKVIAENIDIKVPEEGQVIKRLVELAQERNINYKPSHESLVLLDSYCERRGIQNPLHKGNTKAQNEAQPAVSQLPVYNPHADNVSQNYQQPPPPNMGGGGAPSGGGYSYQVPPMQGGVPHTQPSPPQYYPQQQQQNFQYPPSSYNQQQNINQPPPPNNAYQQFLPPYGEGGSVASSYPNSVHLPPPASNPTYPEPMQNIYPDTQQPSHPPQNISHISPHGQNEFQQMNYQLPPQPNPQPPLSNNIGMNMNMDMNTGTAGANVDANANTGGADYDDLEARLNALKKF